MRSQKTAQGFVRIVAKPGKQGDLPTLIDILSVLQILLDEE
jgi:hypothetical protein